MRLTGGFAVPDRQTQHGQHGNKHLHSHISLNTDMLLGGQQAAKLLKKKKSERRQLNERAAREHEFWAHEGRSDFRGYKSLEAKLKAQELLLGSRARTSAELEMAKGRDGPPRLVLWPELERQSQSAHEARQPTHRDAYTSASERAASRHERDTNVAMAPSTAHEYYDPAKEPLYISQQTSASAVRDMGLRKSFSTWKLQPVHDSTHASSTSSKRPLKSAMKKSRGLDSRDGSQRDDVSLTTVNTNVSERKSRRLDLSQFFPQPRESGRRDQSSPDGKSLSLSRNTELSRPLQQQQGQTRRPTADTRGLNPREDVVSPSIASGVTTRTKVFDGGIFDSSKINVRRPPKGIQNWFDGIDISSDEDEIIVPSKPSSLVEPMKPNKFIEPPKSIEIQIIPQELPAVERQVYGRGERQVHGGQPLPSTFSPWGLNPAVHVPSQSVSNNTTSSDWSSAATDAKAKLSGRSKHAEKRRKQVDSESASSSSLADRQGGVKKPPSRLALSRLASQSVLSLSDSDEDFQSAASLHPPIRDSVDDASIILGNASQIDVQRLPVSPPRQLHSYSRAPGSLLARTHSASTVQTSGTIPIRLTGTVSSSMPPNSPPLMSPPINSPRHGNHNDKALRRLEGQRDSCSQATQSAHSRATSKTPTDFETAYTEPVIKAYDADGETVHSADTGASSALTDNAHLMQVTEDEMQLLEAIRQRRAMKSKNSFAEGYELALKKESEALAQRRQSAQQTALQLLRLKEEKQRLRERGSARQPNTTVDSGDAFEDHLRRKYSFLKREQVDHSLKFEKFLAASTAETPLTERFPETPLADKFPEPPTRTASYDTLKDSHRHWDTKSSRSVRQPSQPQQFELLLPDTYSPVSEKATSASHVQKHRSRRSLSEPPAAFAHAAGRVQSLLSDDEDVEYRHDVVKQFSPISPKSKDVKSAASHHVQDANSRSTDRHVQGSDVAGGSRHYRQSSGLSKIIAGLNTNSASTGPLEQLPENSVTEDDDEAMFNSPPRSPPPRNPNRRSPLPTPLQSEEAGDPMQSIVRTRMNVNSAIGTEIRSAVPSPLRPSLKLDHPDEASVRSPSPRLDSEGGLTASPSTSQASKLSPLTPNWTTYPGASPSASHLSKLSPVTPKWTASPPASADVLTKAPTEEGMSESSWTSYSNPTASRSSASSPPSVAAKKRYKVKKVAQPPRLDTISGNHRSLGSGPSSRASVGSVASASEDVLAAWAELGGVRDVAAMRARKGR